MAKPAARYATLGGSTLPLFQYSGGKPFVSLRFGQKRGFTQRFLLLVCSAVSLLVLVNVALWRLLTYHDEEDADLSEAHRSSHLVSGDASRHSFLAMSDDEALEAMYPSDAARVPRSHSGDPTECEARFTLLLVADMDHATPHLNGSWHSSLRRGSLCWRVAAPAAAPSAPSFSVSWVDEVPLTSGINRDGRGMELSELVWYAGRLLTCDDHTGVVYEVRGGAVVPAYILADGDGHQAHTFKCEWAAVRHGLLYVGGLGRAWTDEAGREVSDPPMWVKVLDGGTVRHANWSANYGAMRAAANCTGAGYLSHEAALWDDGRDRWLFMPRRASREAWSEEADEERGTNLMLWSDGGWGGAPHPVQAAAHTRPQVRVERVAGPLRGRRGFSSVKLLPGTEMLVALKTEEVRGHVASYLTVLSLNGSVLMEDTLIVDEKKYEGLEVAV